MFEILVNPMLKLCQQRGYIILHPAQVRESYLQLVNNLLEAIPDNLYESQHKANTSTRCFQVLIMSTYVNLFSCFRLVGHNLYFPNRLHWSLMRFVNTVPIPPNSTNNTLVFALNNFALLLRDVNPESFSGESLSVNLGPVEEAIRNSSRINEEALVTMMDPLPNATASVELPESLFDGITTYASAWQRILFTVSSLPMHSF